jgi:hypothetical protein
VKLWLLVSSGLIHGGGIGKKIVYNPVVNL